jgi:hypothetical protein
MQFHRSHKSILRLLATPCHVITGRLRKHHCGRLLRPGLHFGFERRLWFRLRYGLRLGFWFWLRLGRGLGFWFWFWFWFWLRLGRGLGFWFWFWFWFWLRYGLRYGLGLHRLRVRHNHRGDRLSLHRRFRHQDLLEARLGDDCVRCTRVHRW